jgi:hypothetical protein
LGRELDEFERAEREAMAKPTFVEQCAALMKIPGDPE